MLSTEHSSLLIMFLHSKNCVFHEFIGLNTHCHSFSYKLVVKYSPFPASSFLHTNTLIFIFEATFIFLDLLMSIDSIPSITASFSSLISNLLFEKGSLSSKYFISKFSSPNSKFSLFIKSSIPPRYADMDLYSSKSSSLSIQFPNVMLSILNIISFGKLLFSFLYSFKLSNIISEYISIGLPEILFTFSFFPLEDPSSLTFNFKISFTMAKSICINFFLFSSKFIPFIKSINTLENSSKSSKTSVSTGNFKSSSIELFFLNSSNFDLILFILPLLG